MRIHGSGGYTYGGPQANRKQNDREKSNPAKAEQQGGGSKGGCHGKGQKEKFQPSYDMPQSGKCGGNKPPGQGGNPPTPNPYQPPAPGPNNPGNYGGNSPKQNPYQPPTPTPGSNETGNYGGNSPKTNPYQPPAPSPGSNSYGNYGGNSPESNPYQPPTPGSNSYGNYGENPFKSNPYQPPAPAPGSNNYGNYGGNPFKPNPYQPPAPGPNYPGNYGPTNPSPNQPNGPSYNPTNGSLGGYLNGGKEGLGVSETSSNGNGSNLGSTNEGWYYNWSPNASGTVNDPNAKFIPMIWGAKNMNPQDLQAAANSDAPMLLTFNEPDHPGQANMSPDEALSYWDQLEGTGKQLSSPAVTNGPDGVKWLDEFMQKASASGKRVDSISLHWYGSSATPTEQNVSALKDYIAQVHQKYPNMPINLTEFGVDANGLSAGQDQGFLTAAESMLNDLPYVQMYAPYGLGSINGN